MPIQPRRSGPGGGSGGSGGPGAQGGKKKFFYRRKRVCKFCVEKLEYIDYKDVKTLQQFIPERGKILPRRISGTCALHQRKLQNAIKRARIAALPLGAILAALLAIPAAQQTSAAEAHMSFAYLLALVLGVGVPALVVLPMVQRGEPFGRVLLVALLISIGGLATTEVTMRTFAS